MRSKYFPFHAFLFLWALCGLALFPSLQDNATGFELKPVLHLENLETKEPPHSHPEPAPIPVQSSDPLLMQVLNLREELGLTPDQVKRIRDQEIENQKNRIRTQAELEISQIELDQLIRSPKGNEADLEVQVQKVQRLQSQLLELKVSTWAALTRILTNDQKEKLEGYLRP